MKIVLTTIADGLDAQVDPRFGRCANYLVVDPDTMEWQTLPNPALNAPGGAGIQAAQFITDQGCEVVLSGDFGPNAFNALKAAGIRMYLYGQGGSAREMIQRYQEGLLESPSAPTRMTGRAH